LSIDKLLEEEALEILKSSESVTVSTPDQRKLVFDSSESHQNKTGTEINECWNVIKQGVEGDIPNIVSVYGCRGKNILVEPEGTYERYNFKVEGPTPTRMIQNRNETRLDIYGDRTSYLEESDNEDRRIIDSLSTTIDPLLGDLNNIFNDRDLEMRKEENTLTTTKSVSNYSLFKGDIDLRLNYTPRKVSTYSPRLDIDLRIKKRNLDEDLTVEEVESIYNNFLKAFPETY